MKLYSSLTILVLMAIPGVNRAEQLEFRVAMEQLPGVDEVHAGLVDEGIAILEASLEPRKSPTWERTIATLCGVYILAEDYRRASEACESAVSEAPGETAFNNRGVLRVHLGDFDGAREDFNRARPEDVSKYLELIRRTDPKLVAVGNTEALKLVRVNLRAMQPREPHRLSSAAIENVLN